MSSENSSDSYSTVKSVFRALEGGVIGVMASIVTTFRVAKVKSAGVVPAITEPITVPEVIEEVCVEEDYDTEWGFLPPEAEGVRKAPGIRFSKPETTQISEIEAQIVQERPIVIEPESERIEIFDDVGDILVLTVPETGTEAIELDDVKDVPVVECTDAAEISGDILYCMRSSVEDDTVIVADECTPMLPQAPVSVMISAPKEMLCIAQATETIIANEYIQDDESVSESVTTEPETTIPSVTVPAAPVTAASSDAHAVSFAFGESDTGTSEFGISFVMGDYDSEDIDDVAIDSEPLPVVRSEGVMADTAGSVPPVVL